MTWKGRLIRRYGETGMSNAFDNFGISTDTQGEEQPGSANLRLVTPIMTAVSEETVMSDRPKNGAGFSTHARAGNVTALASQVLSVVASNSQSGAQFQPSYVTDLVSAVSEFEGAARNAVLERMRGAGVSDADIIDRYIPEAARLLGERWCEDEVSFADVTIGVARLQGILRDLEPEISPSSRAPTVLVLVLPDAYHTLGAMVVASQLRRQGVSVKLSIARSVSEVERIVQAHDFDMVMISASLRERLDSIRNLVKALRQASSGPLPIALGGGVLEQDTNIKTLTGVDHLSNDPREAILACGLTIPTLDAAYSGHTG